MKFIHYPKKSLGQNFLIDKNIINKIIKIENINNNKIILEIGAGYGHLTKRILEMKPKKLFAVEKDKNLFFKLNEDLKGVKNIKIINKDILRIIKNNKFGEKLIVFGNLPYNVSTKILSCLILLKKWPPWYDELILMFQKEVADRIIAKKKSKDFSRLSVLCNWRLDINKHFDVSKYSFFPIPKISSTVLSFKVKKDNKFPLKNPKNLEIVTRVLFSNRRKMINKNFNKLFSNPSRVSNELNLNLTLRPEEISCEMFYKIAFKYENLLK